MEALIRFVNIGSTSTSSKLTGFGCQTVHGHHLSAFLASLSARISTAFISSAGHMTSRAQQYRIICRIRSSCMEQLTQNIPVYRSSQSKVDYPHKITRLKAFDDSFFKPTRVEKNPSSPN